MQVFVLFLTALFITMVTVPLLMKLAGRLRFVDAPGPRKVHTAVIPRVGGIGMVLGTVVAVTLWLEVDSTFRVIFLGIGVLSLFGIADDRCDLDYRLKFLGQIVAVLIVVVGGQVVIRRIGILGIEALPDWFAYPLTIVFVLGTTNAMNLSDGLDGLAAGLSVLSLACIAYLAEMADGEAVVAMAIATIGALFGFLRYNTHPAVVFMGDTGSQFLGFTAGVLSVLVTQEVNTVISGTLPLLILGLPVVDTLLVMGDRLSRGVSPFKPDRNHFHHKLLGLGFDHYEAVLAIYGLQAMFVLLAFFLRYEADAVVLAVYGLLFGGLAVFFPVVYGLRWRIRAKVSAMGGKSPVARWVDYLIHSRRAERLVFIGVMAVLLTLFLAGSIATATVGRDIGFCAFGVLACWVLLTVTPARAVPIERLALYSCVVLNVFLIVTNGSLQPKLERGGSFLVIGLAVMVGLGVRLSRRYFSVTPSDFLVLFILLAAASLPMFSGVNYARLAVEAAVVLYGVEYVLRRLEGPSLLLRAGGMLTLAVLTARGLGAGLMT
jgi:UDP-GlcNAc:undecaprenyl-phosphate GlcNAc-1-phosphate transferase